MINATILVGDHCQKCTMLKTMLGENAMYVKFEKAADNMDLCKRHNIRQVPAMYCHPHLGQEPKIIYDLEEIVDEVEQRVEYGNIHKEKDNK